jgi:lipopolysaccharide transport system ATP-binding protein
MVSNRMAMNFTDFSLRSDRLGLGNIRFIDTWTENLFGQKTVAFQAGSFMKIIARYVINSRRNKKFRLSFSFNISNERDFKLINLSNILTGEEIEYIDDQSIGIVECSIPEIPLNVGSYKYSLKMRDHGEIEDWIIDSGSFEVVEGDFYGTGRLSDKNFTFNVKHNWNNYLSIS